MAPSDRPEAGLNGPRLERLLEFIEQNLPTKLSIAALARVVHMSPFHFARLFKRATGRSPHVFLVHRRVERAKSLLRDGDLPLSQVANAVGFQTQGHFTEVFRRYAGATPRHFRLNSRGEMVHSPEAWRTESSALAAQSPPSAREPGS